jgi:hypothetical protein
MSMLPPLTCIQPVLKRKGSNDIDLLCLVMTHTSQLTETSQMDVALLFEYQIAPQLGTQSLAPTWL